MKRIPVFLSSVIMGISILAGTAAAGPTIGVPVASIGSSAEVGNVDGDGTVRFFIPLDSTATYGVSGGGTSADTAYCGASSGCSGALDMVLRFSPVTTGSNLLDLWFDDIDLMGVNDPDQLLESVEIFDSDGTTSLAFVDSASDPEVLMADYNTQHLQIGLNVAGDPFFAKLHFTGEVTYDGTLINTEETVLAKITSTVPEPGTVALTATALLLMSAGMAVRHSRART